MGELGRFLSSKGRTEEGAAVVRIKLIGACLCLQFVGLKSHYLVVDISEMLMSRWEPDKYLVMGIRTNDFA